jgi:hypothetical protein
MIIYIPVEPLVQRSYPYNHMEKPWMNVMKIVIDTNLKL